MSPILRRMTLAVGLAAVSSLAIVPAQEFDPLVGTWTLNVARSTFDPGPPPKSSTRTYEDRGGGVFVVINRGVDAKGNPTFSAFAAKYDGKHPFANSSSGTLDTISYRRVDASTVEYTITRDGKSSTTTTRTVSKDGRTVTERTKGTNAQGQPVGTVRVYEKQ